MQIDKIKIIKKASLIVVSLIVILLLNLGIKNASKKWTMPVRNWSLTISQLAIFFEGRLEKYLKV